jgi:hypothetical protein
LHSRGHGNDGGAHDMATQQRCQQHKLAPANWLISVVDELSERCDKTTKVSTRTTLLCYALVRRRIATQSISLAGSESPTKCTRDQYGSFPSCGKVLIRSRRVGEKARPRLSTRIVVAPTSRARSDVCVWWERHSYTVETRNGMRGRWPSNEGARTKAYEKPVARCLTRSQVGSADSPRERLCDGNG